MKRNDACPDTLGARIARVSLCECGGGKIPSVPGLENASLTDHWNVPIIIRCNLAYKTVYIFYTSQRYDNYLWENIVVKSLKLLYLTVEIKTFTFKIIFKLLRKKNSKESAICAMIYISKFNIHIFLYLILGREIFLYNLCTLKAQSRFYTNAMILINSKY